MTQIPSLLNTQSSSVASDNYDTLADLDIDSFLKLLIAELQNQDPLNPMDNSEMLNQINQLREISSSDKLTNTLDSVLLGQNITSSTNLIGQDIKAISDDNQSVAGTITRVSIENGKPKLHLDLATKADPSIEKGEVEKGKHAYRVVWQNAEGVLEGVELSGKDVVDTTSSTSNFQSIQLRNLPVTNSVKRIYRTDASGSGDYRLVATLTDGTQSAYLDTTADAARSETRQIEPFSTDPTNRVRTFKISLSNVSEVVTTGT